MYASRTIAPWYATSISAPVPRPSEPLKPWRDLPMNNNTNPSWTSATDGDGIVWLTLDKPDTSANVLSSEVLIELDGLLRPLQQSAPRGVVIGSAKKSGFIAGADIKEFTG